MTVRRDPAPRRSGLSIRYSLPLLISGLAAAVLLVYAAASYRAMKEAALDAARARLTGVTGELSTMLARVGPSSRAQAQTQASNPALVAYLADPTPSRSAAAVEALSGPGNVIGRELRSLSGRRVLSSVDSLPGGDQADDGLASLLNGSAGGAIGTLRVRGDSLTAPIAAPVLAGDTAVGFLVIWSRIAATGQTEIEQLVGSNARMYLGNANGSLWTDLATPVDGPLLDPASVDGVVEYTRPGEGRWLASSAAVAGTPWAVVMEFPRDLVVAGARNLLRSLILFGILALVLAAIVTWLMARRYTAPIMELAHTAEALSDGDYSRRSDVTRGDEIGVLSRSFNDMAASVAQAHDALERQVEQLALMEARNREVGKRLHHVISSSPDVIYEMRRTPDGPAFEWVSENVERLLGCTAEQVCAPGWWREHLHPDDAAPHVQAVRHIAPDGEATREYRLRHADGRYRWIRDRQRPASNGDTTVGAWSDVTDLRSLEEQFRQAQKLEGIGRLAGGIAHDFNNITTVILGEADMALSRAPGDAVLRDSLDQIRTAGVRASMLTRQLLTFSRRQLTETTVFALGDVVRGMQDMLRRLIGEDVELKFRLSDAAANVAADRGQIEQVLVNLVINARDAMPDGGTIVIETQDVVLDAEYARGHADAGVGEFVALVVSDTGMGMTEEVREHLFEPFFTTKGPGKGTGLGLATCYGIARQYGGHIGVYSELDVGTTMKLYLPRAAQAPSATPVPRVAASMPRGDETILLVEDEAQVRAIVARMLIAQGYTVVQASNGEEALHMLEDSSLRVQLLLTDLVMPRMSGRELADHVNRLRPGLRVLFTSGYTEDVIMQNRLLEHDVALLHKPFTRAALAEKVRVTLDAPLLAK